MEHTEKIRSAWIRSTKGLAKRPQLGKVTKSVTARLTDGLTCSIEADGRTFTADMPEIAGGNEAGAEPSTYLEAALASCLAIGYRMALASRDIPVNQIEVKVTGSFDGCGLYGVGDVAAGFDGPVRYSVRIYSPTGEEEVIEALDWSEAHSPLMDILTKPVELLRKLEHIRTETWKSVV